jgi:ssDNA-specific exonuclease RecJ
MELVVDFFLFCLEILFWSCVFTLVISVWKIYQDKKTDVIVEFEEKLRELIHQVQEEKHGDCYYWFDANDNSFLAQGATVEDVTAHLKNRFPDHIFLVNKSQENFYLSKNTDWKFVPIAAK